MKDRKVLFVGIFFCLTLVGCYDSSQPNYQYFPNMYEPVGYEAYAESKAFRNGIEAQIPVDGTISRGWTPYDYPNSNEGYDTAKINLKSLILFFFLFIYFSLLFFNFSLPKVKTERLRPL